MPGHVRSGQGHWKTTEDPPAQLQQTYLELTDRQPTKIHCPCAIVIRLERFQLERLRLAVHSVHMLGLVVNAFSLSPFPSPPPAHSATVVRTVCIACLPVLPCSFFCRHLSRAIVPKPPFPVLPPSTSILISIRSILSLPLTRKSTQMPSRGQHGKCWQHRAKVPISRSSRAHSNSLPRVT